MTTLILAYENDVPYTIEVVKVEPAIDTESIPQPNKEVERKGFLGRTITDSIPQPPLVTRRYAKDGLVITTAEIAGYSWSYQREIRVPGISFDQYADALTKSSNGVVDLRPILKADREKAATAEVA